MSAGPRQICFVAPENAERTFGAIAAALPHERPRRFHDMLLMRPGADPDAWSIAAEVAALAAVADMGDVDLVGYSGGAAICLAYAVARRPAANLTLIEPPWIGNDAWSTAEAAFVARFDAITTADDTALFKGFVDLFAPGVTIAAPPALLPHITGALRRVWLGYRHTPLDRTALASPEGRILLPLGTASTSRMRAQAEYLCETIAGTRILEILEAHHFDICLRGAAPIAVEIEAMAAMA